MLFCVLLITSDQLGDAKILARNPEKGINLVEEAVKPENHFENVDWILGNHTDELTPWIPVIAARSKANFWLLPCCFFDFFSKWNNDGKSSSQVRFSVDTTGRWRCQLEQPIRKRAWGICSNLRAGSNS